MTTPTNCVISGRNLVDEATLSTTVSPATGQPVRHLQLKARARTWKQNSVASVSIKGTWGGAAHYASLLRFEGHNLSGAATHRLQLHLNPDWTGTTVYDSGTVLAYDAATLGELDWGVDPLGSSIWDRFLGQRASELHFAEVIASPFASFTYTLSDPGNTDGLLRGMRLFLGKGIELTYNPSSVGIGWDEAAAVGSRMFGGGYNAESSPRWREISFELEWLTEPQRALLADICRNAGTEKTLYLSVTPSSSEAEQARDLSMLCHFKPPLPRFDTAMYDNWKGRIILVEE